MQLRRSIAIGVLSVGFVGSAFMISQTTAQDAPATQPTSQPTTDPVVMMFGRMARMLENPRMNMTDDQKQKIDDLMTDTETKLNAILTDDQKAQLQKMQQRMMGGRRRGGQGGGPGGGAGGGGNNGGAPGQ